MSGVIATVAPGSVAARLGLRPHDELLAINGHVLRDVLDYQFYAADEALTLEVRRDGETQRYQVTRGYDQELGLEFTEPTFDGIRRCRCRCPFCFIQQMPPHMRRSLYVKDDDYRYSFLFGNFVTLTNLTEEDWQRLEEQRLSPLYVSVHATDPELRQRILGTPAASDILGQLRRLAALGITIQAQIVLVPGLNDGAALQQTVSDLAALYPDVESVGIVPVGLTRYHPGELGGVTPAQAAALVAQAEAWQAAYQSELGARFVYCSDELYLLAGRPLPPADAYDDFPQLENGIGLTRQLLDEYERLRRRTRRPRARYRQGDAGDRYADRPALAGACRRAGTARWRRVHGRARAQPLFW